MIFFDPWSKKTDQWADDMMILAEPIDINDGDPYDSIAQGFRANDMYEGDDVAVDSDDEV